MAKFKFVSFALVFSFLLVMASITDASRPTPTEEKKSSMPARRKPLDPPAFSIPNHTTTGDKRAIITSSTIHIDFNPLFFRRLPVNHDFRIRLESVNILLLQLRIGKRSHLGFDSGQEICGVVLAIIKNPLVSLLPNKPTRSTKSSIPIKIRVPNPILRQVLEHPVLIIQTKKFRPQRRLDQRFPKHANHGAVTDRMDSRFTRIATPHTVSLRSNHSIDSLLVSKNSVVAETPQENSCPFDNFASPNLIPHLTRLAVLITTKRIIGRFDRKIPVRNEISHNSIHTRSRRRRDNGVNSLQHFHRQNITKQNPIPFTSLGNIFINQLTQLNLRDNVKGGSNEARELADPMIGPKFSFFPIPDKVQRVIIHMVPHQLHSLPNI
ncbi:putative ribonuclease H protein [Senna tora]|uniref:Putative ribonuclease H protein n=1 Tax=Senna tora TaxID=362788 RepID=A0A834WBN0_9FABA|nr:putative ribonuclease H protein [Senna tora]